MSVASRGIMGFKKWQWKSGWCKVSRVGQPEKSIGHAGLQNGLRQNCLGVAVVMGRVE